MMRFTPQITFKGVATDTHRKNENEEDSVAEDVHNKWRSLFDEIIVSYFDGRDIRSFHEEFDPIRDKLDCRVPSMGSFACGGDEAVIGKLYDILMSYQIYHSNESSRAIL